MESITSFFANNFDSCVWLAVMLVAVIPTLESKISVPLAMNSAIWGAGALSPISALLISFLGTILPSYLVIFIGRKIKKHTSLMLHSKFFQKYAIKSVKINRQASLKKYFMLATFVAVPIPLTGVWSGSLIAGLSDLNPHYSFIAIAIGSLISTSAITLLCTVFTNSITTIFMLTLIIIIAFLLIDLISSYIKPKKKEE